LTLVGADSAADQAAVFIDAGSETCFSSFFLMRRTSTKINAVMVQIKQPNITESGSIDGGLPSPRYYFFFS
jgi:hypothetical protein